MSQQQPQAPLDTVVATEPSGTSNAVAEGPSSLPTIDTNDAQAHTGKSTESGATTIGQGDASSQAAPAPANPDNLLFASETPSQTIAPAASNAGTATLPTPAPEPFVSETSSDLDAGIKRTAEASVDVAADALHDTAAKKATSPQLADADPTIAVSANLAQLRDEGTDRLATEATTRSDAQSAVDASMPVGTATGSTVQQSKQQDTQSVNESKPQHSDTEMRAAESSASNVQVDSSSVARLQDDNAVQTATAQGQDSTSHVRDTNPSGLDSEHASKTRADLLATKNELGDKANDAGSSDRLIAATDTQQVENSRTDIAPSGSLSSDRSELASPHATLAQNNDEDKAKAGIAEHAQDKEQRTRDRERRKEQERMEREREREREQNREAERDREMMIARENEEARLIWLSLPGNDHPQYYTDTDSDSCYGVNGATGVDLTDEEDKDLEPPAPLTQQEYYPAPSHSLMSYHSFLPFDRQSPVDMDDPSQTASYTRKRKRLPKAATTSVERPPSATGAPIREALPSAPMISIDDFQAPDSSVRGEVSEVASSSRLERPIISGASPFSGNKDLSSEYSSDSDEDAERAAGERKRRHGNRGGNRGNKLSRSKGARWVRRGKLGGWTEMRMDKEIGDRIRHRVEAMQRDNVRALLSAAPIEDRQLLTQFAQDASAADRLGRGLRDARGRMLPSDLSEAARIDIQLGLGPGTNTFNDDVADENKHLTSTSLAPTLLKPAVTPRQLLMSHTLRHTFRNPHIGALGKTALDLIESEVVLGRAVGRCWGSMERGGWEEDPEPKGTDELDATDERDDMRDAMDVDSSSTDGTRRQTNGARDTHDDVSENPFGSVVDNPALSHLDKLFVTKRGLAIPRLDENGQPIFVISDSGTKEGEQTKTAENGQPDEPAIETTLMPAPEQRSIVLAALECLHDLAADSREYVERLEEVRSRLAAVKRTRAQVWYAVRQWALDKDQPSVVDLSNQSIRHTIPTVVTSTSPRKRK